MRVLRQVSVEPSLLLYYVASSIASLASTNLLLQKACSPTHPPEEEVCDELKDQKIVTSIITWRPLFEYSVPIVIILFAGAWSDAHGKRRKPLMIIPIAGEILTIFFLTSSVFFWQWSPEVTAFFESLIRGVTGGRTCFSIGAVTYVSDNTYPEERTFRLAIVTASIFIAIPIGSALGGILRVTLGFYTVFNVCLILNVLALLSALILLNRYSDDVPVERPCGFPQVLNTWRTVFKARTGYKRPIVLLMIIVSPLFGGCLMGEYSVLYFYLRYKFHWGESEYGYYAAFRMSLTFFGTLISVGVFSKWLKMEDAVIGLIAATSQTVAALGNAFAQRPWQMFVYPSVDLMHGAVYTVGHSIVSKIVEPTELGQINSVLGMIDSLAPLVVIPLYSKTYNLTLQQWPGSYFLLSALLASLTWGMFLTVIIFNRQDRRKIHTTIS